MTRAASRGREGTMVADDTQAPRGRRLEDDDDDAPTA
jgi:hypothetical protein